MVSRYRINITLDSIGPNHYVGSNISEYLQCSERISDDEQRPGKEMALMPTLLSTTVKHIHESAKFCELEVNRGFSLLHERQHDL
ncbi:MAG: hypothetical protein WBL67_12110 [Nitrososphaeraceae archaeon]